ncbi:nucleotidyl transferase AbiEii/AbiGii toxin family protein [bacterium]|nr:nucleotidyl transferase AbiEii/AbiGii toxin family protein [bacterium]
MKQSSIFAHKLVALSERMKNRDLFDVDYFFKQ